MTRKLSVMDDENSLNRRGTVVRRKSKHGFGEVAEFGVSPVAGDVLVHHLPQALGKGSGLATPQWRGDGLKTCGFSLAHRSIFALSMTTPWKVERFGWTFAPGDKVMQIVNDYDKEVYNGDIGYVGDVDPEVGEVTVTFDGRVVTYGFGELDVLVPAYATTIHKSQGSEYPRDHSGPHAALPDAATQPALHRRHPREAPRRPGRPEEGGRHRSPQRSEQAALVETWRVALGERSPTVTSQRADRNGLLQSVSMGSEASWAHSPIEPSYSIKFS